MQPSCAGEDPALLPVAVAEARIADALVALDETERVDLRAALGRVLASDMHAPFDVPPHRNAAMDGYALNGDDLPGSGQAGAPLRRLRVVGTAWAGRPYDGPLDAGQAVRVMTGARMPDAADTVIMQEQVELEETSDDAHIRIDAGHRRGQNVRAAGEDLRRDSLVLGQGQRIGAAELGLLASLGQSSVLVWRRLRVALFSTGDELRDPGEALEPGAIHDSNRYTLHGLLQGLGVEVLDMGILPDELSRIETALAAGAAAADVLITSGGVSASAADHVKTALARLGEVGFWKIAIRPGRPLAFGRIGAAAFFGLPGNPVAVMVTYYHFVRPALRQLMGERPRLAEPTIDALCTSRLRKRAGRVEYYRAVLERDEQGRLTVRSQGAPGSGLLHTMSAANCFVVLPHAGGNVEPGEVVQVRPFFGLT